MANNNHISKQPLNGKIAVISGGSKGIGKETAKQILRLGGSVCVIARGAEALEKAVSELEASQVNGTQFIDSFTCDATDHTALQPLLNDFVERRGVPDYLINVVGYATPDYIEKIEYSDFRNNMETNYFGQVAPLLVLLPHFLKAKKGHVAFVSSMLGFMGIVGYATYAPSKYALVGLAEVVRHELKPYNIKVSILYPPDTDTPGFEVENENKPPETAMVSDTAKLYPPERVAEIFVKGLLKKKFHIAVGDARWIWPLMRYFPRLVHFYIDSDYAAARKKLGK